MRIVSFAIGHRFSSVRSEDVAPIWEINSTVGNTAMKSSVIVAMPPMITGARHPRHVRITLNEAMQQSATAVEKKAPFDKDRTIAAATEPMTSRRARGLTGLESPNGAVFHVSLNTAMLYVAARGRIISRAPAKWSLLK